MHCPTPHAHECPHIWQVQDWRKQRSVTVARYGVPGQLLGYVSNGKRFGQVEGGLESEREEGARVQFDKFHPDMARHPDLKAAAELMKSRMGIDMQPPPWNLTTRFLRFEETIDPSNGLPPLRA